MRNVKIIATLGPASSSREVITELALAGVNVFRLNMSHGNHELVRDLHGHIRAVEAQHRLSIGILGDLQGPKLRCGTFSGDNALIRSGDVFTFDMNPAPGNESRVCLPHPEIFQALENGATILVNDGLLSLQVEECGSDYAHCRVVSGGTISNRKGVNIPSVTLPISPLSVKDRKDLEFLCSLGVDWIALSFVQRPQDVTEAASLLRGRAKIMAKIEKPVAVRNIAAIIEEADGIMIARGDLGVEMPVQKLPSLQKKLLALCREAGKPVVVATQMLESMIFNPVPTRAEVNDVATAIYDGADAIMLSAETAAGKYPVNAVKTMVDVAQEVEHDAALKRVTSHDAVMVRPANPLAAAARAIATSGKVAAICCFTRTGSTAIDQARERPVVPIFALTPDKETARFLSLVWGVRASVVPSVKRFGDAVKTAVETVRATGSFASTAHIAVTAGMPVHRSGGTNILRMAALDGSDIDESNDVGAAA